MENTKEVRTRFDEVAHQYDNQRRKLIPCFDDFYEIAVSIARTDSTSPHILDLGAGTGLFSSLILQKYPTASITLIDISEKMLETAQERLKGFSNVRYIVGDYTNFVSQETYDMVISALSIHHLSDANKWQLYQNSYANLKKNGVFINADQVLGHTPFIESLYKKDWKQKVEASDLSKDEIESAYERTKLDQMSPLETQVKWLQQAGFSDVDCVYKYFNFVVLHGRKTT
ncbi:methyltransferase domain-containing protein [Brevibacillus brevis]|uniref:Methyltransferase domain-containing protein n=1 Tax=Brevibacillus brevis TaxID=1393 RepID=A0ABY9SXX4_BREBE|nr:methyltransferase domain-containing protein [Brevibacillus brevis]WNC12119.1 methyltransferase domain-containing protein [Brevibacillus brevis]